MFEDGWEGFGDYEGVSGVSDPVSVPSFDYGYTDYSGLDSANINNAFDYNVNNTLEGSPDRVFTGSTNETPGFGDRLASSFSSPQGVAALLNAGIATASGLASASSAEKRDKQASKDAKFNAMLQLAKLKYGSGGGGNPLAGPTMQINAIQENKEGRTGALGSLASNLGNIFSRGGR